MNAPTDSYSLRFDVDYPDQPRNRLTTFFRLFTVIPIGIVLAFIDSSMYSLGYLDFLFRWVSWVSDNLFNWGPDNPFNWVSDNLFNWDSDNSFNWIGFFGWGQNAEGEWELNSGFGLLFIPVLLMLLFRRKYPRWWFDWNLELLRFAFRVSAYFWLLRDEYPSTDEEQAIHLDIDYPDAQQDLNRWLPLVKWFLAIPHYIILIPLSIVALLCTIVAWFAILFTGRYPRDLFNLVVGVDRWWLRVSAYAFILVTDQYPPFRLSE